MIVFANMMLPRAKLISFRLVTDGSVAVMPQESFFADREGNKRYARCLGTC